MQITAQPNRMRKTADDLLLLSETLRALRRETEDIGRRLRFQSELTGCIRELAKQEEALALLTARLVYLSAGLRQISLQYQTTEEDCQDRLEDMSTTVEYGKSAAGFLSDEFQNRVTEILQGTRN